MTILALLHGYPPTHNAGAEHMLHALLREMVRRGHTVRVVTGPGKLGSWEGTLDGVEVVTRFEPGLADVVVSHLDWTRRALDYGRVTGVPVAYVVHNPRQMSYWGIQPADISVAVFNSYWLAEAVEWRGAQVVVRPPVDWRDYQTDRTCADSITLINLREEKGSGTFCSLAAAFPDRKFLGVEGAYGEQENCSHANITRLPHQPDIREVYRRTRILLMPSHHETWGRTAIEACSSGIPVIAHPTEGLQEALGKAGIFRDRKDLGGWIEAVRMLDDPKVYAKYSRLARRRARELDPTADYDRFEEALAMACTNCGKKKGAASVTRGASKVSAKEAARLLEPVRMRALCNFECQAYEGAIRKGQVFETPEHRARTHERDRRAVRV